MDERCARWELITQLQSAGTRWSAATTGANSAARLQLDSGTAVITIGGFAGADPAPTLTEFQTMVSAGQVHYYVVEWSGPAGSRSEIADWVAESSTPTPVGGRTVYDLTRPR